MSQSARVRLRRLVLRKASFFRSCVVLCLVTNIADADEVNSYKQRQVDQVDVGNGGNPLPPPKSSTRTPSQSSIDELCQKLRHLGQSPEYCK
jgi:hypothetical protein